MKRFPAAAVLLGVALSLSGLVQAQVNAAPGQRQCYCNGRYTVVTTNDCRTWCLGSSSPSATTSSPVNSALVNAASQASSQIGSAIGTAIAQFLFGAPADPQAALQKQQMMAELQRRQAEAERQHREEEAARLNAMYNRLLASMKLSGLPSLSLKLGSDADGPAGIKGLPGIALNDGKVPYGIPGLPGIYVGGPGEGSGLPSSKLALKTGDSQAEATPSASGQPPGASVADNSAVPAGQVTTFDPSKMTPQQLADVAEQFGKLPPGEQERLLKAAQSGAADGRPAPGAGGPTYSRH